ncbi:MAG: acetate--CoA ligase family protein [Candidatus Magasanikbacteria bacterium]|nr:acetate--CoA ligase family protein [Candidatus Magasanikbacteria bacterium]
MKQSLNKLFNPKSIAVVGASHDEKKLGNIVLKNIVESGFKGKIYPLNPEVKEVRGLKTYSAYAELPAPPDVAVVAVPAALVLRLLPAIAERGTRNLVIFSAGFKEAGGDGVSLDKELVELAQKYQLNILGPNCLGFVNNRLPINATFGNVVKNSGNLRFISQSGAIATSAFDWSAYTGLGFSDFITLGNKTIIKENDVLRYWLEEVPESSWVNRSKLAGGGSSRHRPIGMYLESIEKGTEFLELVKKFSLVDPVFILRPGKSSAAQAATQSHTGAIANDDAVLNEALKQAGAIRVDGLEDFFNVARAFAWEDAPEGPRVAIVSNAGGPAVVATDAAITVGLELAELSPKTEKILAEHLPKAANIHNPIDVLGDALADRYANALQAVLAENSVDAVVVILTPQVMTQIEATAKVIGELSHQTRKPILCSFMGGSAIERGERILNQYRIPSFRYPENALQTLSKMWQWRERQKGPRVAVKVAKLPAKPAKSGESYLKSIKRGAPRQALSSLEAQEFLRKIGFLVPDFIEIMSHDEAGAAAKKFGYPVVIKLSSAAILHKSDVGGVIVNIYNEDQLNKALRIFGKTITQTNLAKNADVSVLLQKQIVGGVDLIVGFKRDPSFGPVLLCGAGGVTAELWGDTALAILPIDKAGAEQVLKKNKIYKLLAGWRGSLPLATTMVYQTMEAISRLAFTYPEIKEMEINPLIVTESKCWAVDGRIILE